MSCSNINLSITLANLQACSSSFEECHAGKSRHIHCAKAQLRFESSSLDLTAAPPPLSR